MVSVPSAMDITYCEGARLLQDSQTDIDSVLVQRPNGNLTCKHCYLVIADADNITDISSDKDWPLVVSCHVQACASLHDRRAAYSCYACLERGKTSIETSAAALKGHLRSCALIKDIQPSKAYQRQESIKEGQVSAPAIPERPKRGSRPAPGVEAAPLRQSSRDVETAQSSGNRRPVPSNPFRPGQSVPPLVPNSPVTPVKQTNSHGASPAESSPTLPSRPKTGVSTHAERTYTPSNAPRPEQSATVNHPRSDVADVFNVPGGFPGHEAASHDPRSPFFHEFPPTPPPPRVTFSNDHTTTPIRRKDVKLESNNSQASLDSSREDRSFPTRPTRAPPAPPVLSPPAPAPAPAQGPIPYLNSNQSMPMSPPVSNPRFDVRPGRPEPATFQNPFNNSDMTGNPIQPANAMQSPRADSNNARADLAKIQQLAALGITRARAEYLLSQTGGDVNEAAELGFSAQHSNVGDDGSGGWLPTASQAVQQPDALPSTAAERRNRRSR